MLLHPSNFLLLDEPTNHLDLRAQDVLLESLQKFTGTVVFVSHDRYFIDKLATRVFEIGEGRVEVFPGNYEDYLRSKEGAAAEPAIAEVSRNGSRPPGVGQASTSKPAEPPAPEPEAKQKRINPLKLKQMQDRCQDLEEEIARLEAAIALTETALQNFVSVEETQRQSIELQRTKSELEERMAEWEELAQTLAAQ
jgi:ATP-binding cassette, subfamily F, member 3